MTTQQELEQLAIAAWDIRDMIYERTNLLEYDYETGTATCTICGGRSHAKRRAFGTGDIIHAETCRIAQLDKAVQPFHDIWTRHLDELFPWRSEPGDNAPDAD